MQFLDFPSKGPDKEVNSISINPTHIHSFSGTRDAGGKPLVSVLMADGTEHFLDISYTDFQKKLAAISVNSTTYVSNHYHGEGGLA